MSFFQKGGGVRANPKVLRQFWGSFGAVLRQNFCNISSISKGRNDFTHHQLKDYDVFSVKKLEIRLTEKSASEIPKVRGGGQRLLEKLIFKQHFLFGKPP